MKITIATILLTAMLTGCYSESSPPKSNPPSRQMDWVFMSIIAENFNQSQTNWTVVVLPR